MNILIVGATGMIGHRLWLGLSKDFEVHAILRRSVDSIPIKDRIDLSRTYRIDDVQNKDALEKIIARCTPDLVINCVGVVKQLDLSKDYQTSIALNSLFPHQLSEICQKYNARMIQFSTDCVFKGDRGMYSDFDTPDATDIYGRTKTLGEIDYAEHVLTLRTSFIGREIFPHGSLITWFESQRGNTIQGFSKAIYSGLPTNTLVRIFKEKIIPAVHIHGIYNLSSAPIGKYQLLKLVKDLFKLDIVVENNARFKVDRSLDSTKLRNLLNIEIPCWENLVEDLLVDNEFYMGLNSK